MRRIEYTRKFKRDYRREKSGRYAGDLDERLKTVLDLLVEDEPLPHNKFDHALTGNWSDHRDCHIRPDLVLIYRKSDEGILQLVRLGSHSELGL